ncbi:PREDICTED: uncharacterized protein LOC109147057 [Ipomoea nil]|uniref:uncharacterized protein LOC109147057 n=1 Tax=Ipomoea nil TaxID=35883 RepID=UPI000900A9DD|nr:PREDICTED: uncharacterized protein LOC109147057 [Ipomoea nil]
MSTNSSERTVTASPVSAPATQNTLSSAHHFVSIKLNARNFLFWRTQLVPFLRGQGLLGYVDGGTPCPPATIDTAPTSGDTAVMPATSGPNPAHQAWMQQDQSILSLLISSLSDEVMYLAVGRTTSKAVWDSITAALGSSKRARCLNLYRPISFVAARKPVSGGIPWACTTHRRSSGIGRPASIP